MSLDLKMPSFADFFSNHTIPKTRITKKQVGNLHGSWHTIDDWETRLKKLRNDTRLAKVDHMDFLVLDSQENDARLLDVHVYAMNVS